MNSKTAWLVGGQLLSLAAISWLWSENRELRGHPTDDAGMASGGIRHGRNGAHDSGSVEITGARAAVSPERRAAVEKAKSAGSLPAVASRPAVESAPDGGVILRWPGGGRSVAMSPEELMAFEQELRAARLDPLVKKPGGPSWTPGQSAGPPDTASHGDFATAWASAAPDGGKEWLQLSYPNATEIKQVVIHESYNPGAVSRVLALMPDGSEQVLWEGTESVATPGQKMDSVFEVPAGIRSDRLRVELDTKRVPGWNEIDAVELVGSDGSRQWASESTASSFYGEGRSFGLAAQETLRLDVGDLKEYEGTLRR
jgi:hypothetical protein